MEILERNYSEGLQSYTFSDVECDNEAKILLRWNLLSRLSKLVKGELNQEDKIEELLPRTKISITKVHNPEVSNKTMYLSELKVGGMKFPSTEDSIDDSLVKNMDSIGVEIPKDSLDKKLKGFYSNRLTSTPFNILKLRGKDLSESKVTEKEFSYIEDSLYADEDEESHYKMVRAVSMLALHKHVTENPSSPKERLIQGINNLSKEITNEARKSELHDYLMIYIDKPGSRPLLVKEAQMVIDDRSKKVGKGIPLWAIMTVISLILVGGILYSQRDRIKAAWKASNGLKNTDGVKPDFNTKKTFFQMLFTRNGREAAKGWVNKTKTYKSTSWEINDIPLRKRKLEVERDEASRDLKDIFMKWGK